MRPMGAFPRPGVIAAELRSKSLLPHHIEIKALSQDKAYLLKGEKGLEQKMRPMEAFPRPGVIAAELRSRQMRPMEAFGSRNILKLKLYRKIELFLYAIVINFK